MSYGGNYGQVVPASSTVDIFFTTNSAAGAAVAPSTAFEAADVKLYKDHTATPRSSQAGWTMTSPFNSIVGLHQISIDLSDNTDAGFYAAGHVYTAVLSPDTETVDSQVVASVIGQFLIGVDPADTVRMGLTALPNATAGANTGLPVVGTQIPNATAGANNGLPVQGGAIPNANAGASGGLVEIGTSTNNFKSDASAQVTAASVQGNVTGSVASVTGAVGSVTGNVGGNVVGSVASVTGAVGSVTGNVGGNVTGSVGSINLSQALTQHDVSALATSTIGDALSAARAQGAGEWDLTGTTLTLKNPDGTTFRTLTLDSATAPTSRS